MTYHKALTALADPTRQRLYERLRRRDHSVGELVAFARISQPAVSQHLKVLSEARLVTQRRDGTRRYYRACRDGLVGLRAYVDSLWADALDAFAADDPAPPRPRRGRPR